MHPCADPASDSRHADPRRVRVPGPEVLRRLPRLPARVALEQDQGRLRRPGPGADHGRRGRPTCRCSWARSSTPGRSPSTPPRWTGPGTRRRSRSWPAARADDSEGFFVRPTILHSPDPADEIFTTEYFGPILAVHVYPDAAYEPNAEPGRGRRAVRADRRDPGHGPRRDRPGHRGAAVLGGQLLHQRQADRRGGRPAAVRRRQGQRHRRQGRLGVQPDPLGERPRDQGTLRAPVRLPLPSHGVTESCGGRHSPAGSVEHRPDPGRCRPGDEGGVRRGVPGRHRQAADQAAADRGPVGVGDLLRRARAERRRPERRRRGRAPARAVQRRTGRRPARPPGRPGPRGPGCCPARPTRWRPWPSSKARGTRPCRPC